MEATSEAMAERVRMALELQAAGIEMKRLALRRQHPDESEEQVAERPRSWLQDLEPRDLGPGLAAGTWPRRP
jgi:hypothetical protein